MTHFYYCTKCNRPMKRTVWNTWEHFYLGVCDGIHAYWKPTTNQPH